MSEYTQDSLKTKINADLADNAEGDITAKDVRDAMVHIVDSINPIMASGSSVYFQNDIAIWSSGVLTKNTALGVIKGQWGKNSGGFYDTSAIRFSSGGDTVNKDDGHISFYTAPSGTLSTTGGPDLRCRMMISNSGVISMFGSGVVHPTLHLQSLHGSGLNLLFDGSPKDMAVPAGKNFHLGHWHSSTSTFTNRFTINHDGHLGLFSGYLDLGADHPLQPVHVRHSGVANAVRFDSQNSSSNTADLLLYKYDTGTASYSADDMHLGFGMGVNAIGSGNGYFFMGHDTSRNFSVTSAESMLVISSGGNVGIGTTIPKEKLVVGEDLGDLSTTGTAVVIGAKNGPSQLFIGSGINNPLTAQYAKVKWEDDNQRLVLSTKRNYHYADQLVLDSTNGNVGIGGSGHPTTIWHPSYNLHVAASGTSGKIALENSRNTETAIYIGKDTDGTGSVDEGHWSQIGYKSATEVLKINNSGSFIPSHLTIDRLGRVGISTDSVYGSNTIGTDKLHIHGENTGVIIGTPVGGSGKTALRLLGSRESGSSSDDNAFIQVGTTSADTGAKLRITRMDSDATNFERMDVYADIAKFHGSGVFVDRLRLDENLMLNDNWLSNDGGDEGLKVGDDGKVAIGKTPGATHIFELNSGQGAQPTSTLWVNTSDSRIKENVATIDTSGALDKIMLLRPVSFNYTDDFCHCISSDPDRTHYNFIAQEVSDVFPDSVIDTDNYVEDYETGEISISDLKGLDSHAINIHLVSAVQELKTQLDAALVRISELES
jgi:hypothetical protein